MSIDLKSAIERLCAIEEEAFAALATPLTVDAVPRFYHWQEITPYATHRLGPLEVDDDGQEFDLYRYSVIARVVIGHMTEGYTGQNEERLQTWLPALVEYINERELLQSAAYTTALDNLIRARVASASGYTVFVNSAIGGVTQVGVEITVRLEFEEQIEQAYL